MNTEVNQNRRLSYTDSESSANATDLAPDTCSAPKGQEPKLSEDEKALGQKILRKSSAREKCGPFRRAGAARGSNENALEQID